ncbi:MAG: LysM peptidoglycan-binding domain-containing protein [Verrucomicrobia bacterium]|nr:LysM peptidoglycan-binding domain-containing protein [Verrucomicrobiota bacterium]MCF7708871.1 LysM peptidoglycan-binding domain-containing protein [Verrucomicrobiota bacterium]
MKNENPLIPQGSFLENKKSRGKSNLVIAAVTIVAIHIVLFGSLLMQGCKRQADTSGELANAEETGQMTNELPPFDPSDFPETFPSEEQTNVPAAGETNLGAATDGRQETNLMGMGAQGETQELTTTPQPQSLGTEYTVKSGDSFYKIAKDHGVSVKAIVDANPGLDPRRLQIGQKIVIPAPTAAEQSAAAPADDGNTYVVQSGDTLIGIARKFGTTVSALKESNNLRTDRILVGQKLVLPSASAGE